MNKFFKYLKKDLHKLILSLFFALVYVSCSLAIPFLVGKCVDCFDLFIKTNQHIYMEQSSTYIHVMALLLVLDIIFEYFFEFILGFISYKVSYRIRHDIYKKYNSVSIKQIDSMKMGDLLQRNIGDVENVLNGLQSTMNRLILGIINIIATIIFMFVINYIMALTVVVLTPISIFVSKFVSKRCAKYFKEQSKCAANVSSNSLEIFDNLKLVQSFNYQDRAYEKFLTCNKDFYKAGQHAMFSSSWVNPSTRLVNNIIYCIVSIVGIILLIFEPNVGVTITIGGIASFLSYTMKYSKPFNEVSSVMAEIGTAVSSFKRISSFVILQDDIDKGKIDSIDEIKSIEFDNVCFSYFPDKELIKNFNAKITKGMKVAIVGPTGCGKTTMINLLMRFYDPINGSIKINGIDSREYTKKALRDKFKMVLQDSWIFDGTIYENVSYSTDNCTREEVISACKKAKSDGFINMLNKGYDTFVGSNSSLSDGEKQLICISRCMLSISDVVILDEATSSIDSRTEIKISKAMDELIKGKTSFVIAHRLSTIVNSDLILVMKDGDIIEQGKHEDLLKQNDSFYKKLYISQFEN